MAPQNVDKGAHRLIWLIMRLMSANRIPDFLHDNGDALCHVTSHRFCGLVKTVVPRPWYRDLFHWQRQKKGGGQRCLHRLPKTHLVYPVTFDIPVGPICNCSGQFR